MSADLTTTPPDDWRDLLSALREHVAVNLDP